MEEMQHLSSTAEVSQDVMPPRPKYFRHILIILIALAVLLPVSLYFATRNSFLPSPASLTPGRNNPGPTIGDLGGVPVSIPRTFANFLEYERDPHWLERRGYEPPPRTFQSKITSFGFEVRFPDMAGVDASTQADRRSSSIYNTNWMRVGINASSSCLCNVVKHSVEDIPTKLKHRGPQFRYERLPEPVFGLVAFAPKGFSEAHRSESPPRSEWDDKTIYYHQDEHGRINTHIECSNVNHDAAPCSQRFVLTPDMEADVTVSYRRGHLAHWREIQESVTKLIRSFQVDSKQSKK